ncbi:cytochrome c-type biogenesis protein [Asticcacaulis solisilvae]|uniref:cytochrome c-type biogenesis protein n=1 Tax=Asticcacaulis solisilvae TaxID=1217274 RepID=UPI003FD7300C
MKALALSVLLLLPAAAHADPAGNEARAQKLFTEVRCVACQGQDIADSDAAIAADMRREIRQAIAAGRSDAAIRADLYRHYGDYVLFRPRLSASNLILWGVPPLIVIGGVAVFLIMTRRRGAARAYALSEAEQARLDDLTRPE